MSAGETFAPSQVNFFGITRSFSNGAVNERADMFRSSSLTHAPNLQEFA